MLPEFEKFAIGLKQHGTLLRSLLTKELIDKASAGNSDAQCQVGLLALYCNEIGMAWTFLKLAEQAGNAAAKQYILALENKNINTIERMRQCFIAMP